MGRRTLTPAGAAWRLAEPPAGRPPAGRTRPSLQLGRDGEEIAARALEAAGCRILERRFRTRGGEIDLVALDRGVLVFVEVKTRSSTACGRPAEAVDARKRGRILRAARFYLLRHGYDRPCRFDVIEILAPAGGAATLEHIRDAFQDDGSGW